MCSTRRLKGTQHEVAADEHGSAIADLGGHELTRARCGRDHKAVERMPRLGGVDIRCEGTVLNKSCFDVLIGNPDEYREISR